MADSYYQIPTTPKLYISYPLFKHANGQLITELPGTGTAGSQTVLEKTKLIQMDPSNATLIQNHEYVDVGFQPRHYITYFTNTLFDNANDVTEADILATQQAWNFDFIGILNHNLHSAQNAVNIYSDGLSNEEIELSNIVNWNVGDIPEYNGFSLASIDATPANITDSNCKILFDIFPAAESLVPNIILGSLIFGKSYTFPQNCTLRASSHFEYGIKEKTTKSGKTIPVADWTHVGTWNTRSPWELHTSDELRFTFDDDQIDMNRVDTMATHASTHRRSGRRKWIVEFDSLQPRHVMPQNLMTNSNGYQAQDNHETDGSDNSLFNMYNGDDFFTSVINKTQANRLPMILQINKDDPSPSNFACVRMGRNYRITQKSPNLYNIKVEFIEQI